MSDSYTWGISGTSFLLLYAGLCVATAAAIWLLRRQLLDVGEGGAGTPSLDVYELAMLNGGPQLAVTTAAAKLHNEGALEPGPHAETIIAARRPSDALALEREVFDAVEPTNGAFTRLLRDQLASGPAIGDLTAKLTGAGLLLDERRRSIVDALWLLALPVLALGLLRMIAGLGNGRPILFLGIGLVVAICCTVAFARVRTRATARGAELLDAQRGERRQLSHTPPGAEIALAVALFGAGVLWIADPGLASAWAVPRDAGVSGGSGSGSGSSGGGGCGGGGCGGGGCGG